MQNYENQTENTGKYARSHRDEMEEKEISLRPFVRILWNYRRVLILSISLAMIAFVLLALTLYLIQPIEHQSSIEFKLLFDGADHDQYPNGLPFSRAEIISTPVLTKVYEANDLKRYTTYDEFKNAVLIVESSRDLDLLRLEYQAKLGDTRLTSVDRSRLEQEFKQKEQALRVPQYTLTFMSAGLFARMPDALMNKVLNDILATWAEQAVDRKGVLKYQVRVFTPNVLLKDFLSAEDYLVRLDIMRDKINAIIVNVDELLRLPGANLVRVGESGISLPEIRANFEDVLRFKLEPLMVLIQAKAITKDGPQLTKYVDNRLNQAELERQEAAGKVTTLQEALKTYVLERGAVVASNGRDGSSSGTTGASMIPQISESFLDRIMQLSNQNGDLQYKQKLTDDIIKAGQIAVTKEKESMYYKELAASVRRGGAARDDQKETALIEERLNDIYTSVVNTLGQVDSLFKEISRQNLNPRTNLYTITSPFRTSREAAVSIRTLATYGAVTLILVLILGPLVCIVHYYLRQEVLPQPIPVVDTAGDKPVARAAAERT